MTTTTSLLKIAREIGAAILNAREEAPLIDYVIGRLREAMGFEHGAILLSDGEKLNMASLVGGSDAHPSPLFDKIGQLQERWKEQSISDVHILHDLPVNEHDALLPESHALKTIIIIPLFTHGAPMGVIVLGDAAVFNLNPSETDILLLVGQVLASGLREMRLHAKLNETLRLVPEHAIHQTPEDHLDPITKLGDRQFAMSVIRNEVADAVKTGGQFSILLVEIDHFTSLINRYGAEFGNSVLAKVSEVVKSSIRGRDMAACYYLGGFCVVLPSTPGIGAVVVAERFRDRIASLLFQDATTSWHVTTSVAVACLSNRVSTQDQLLAKAEMGLAQSRQLGGGQVIFDWDEAFESVVED